MVYYGEVQSAVRCKRLLLPHEEFRYRVRASQSVRIRAFRDRAAAAALLHFPLSLVDLTEEG